MKGVEVRGRWVESADWGRRYTAGIRREKGGRTEDEGRASRAEKGVAARPGDYAITMGTSSAKPPIMGSSSSSSPFGRRTNKTSVI